MARREISLESREPSSGFLQEWESILLLDDHLRRVLHSEGYNEKGEERDPITEALNRSLAANPEGSTLPPIVQRIQNRTIKMHSDEW